MKQNAKLGQDEIVRYLLANPMARLRLVDSEIFAVKGLGA
jgi:hypothetical protein